MNDQSRPMLLGVSMRGHGYNDSAWMDPGVAIFGPHQLGHYKQIVDIAERGVFDLAFLADLMYFPMTDRPSGVLGRRGDAATFEPITLLSALAAVTQNIGLVSTASTTFYEPYLIARLFASLDLISGGRAGWNVVTSSDDDEARNFGMAELPDKASRYERATEAIEIVMGLWDSFDAGAFCGDRETGRYFRPDRVRVLGHTGTHFSVKGPLNVPASPQGRPIIVQAGGSSQGMELAARTADIVYTLQNDPGRARAFRREIHAIAQRHGRTSESVKVMPGMMPIVGSSRAEAHERAEKLKALIDPLIGLEYLANYFGDLSEDDLDGPVPPLRDDQELASRGAHLSRLATERSYSVRQLYQSVCFSNGHCVMVGTATDIADEMQSWFESGAADGFNILPAVSPDSLDQCVSLVIPVLQSRGLTKKAYIGSTLRSNLQLG